jgi:hypothetical protein
LFASAVIIKGRGEIVKFFTRLFTAL